MNSSESGNLPEHCDPQILKEIDYCMKHYQLKPKVMLAYDRKAFQDKENSVIPATFSLM